LRLEQAARRSGISKNAAFSGAFFLQFEVLSPREDGTKVLLYEVYRDDAAFHVHWDGCIGTELPFLA
jgi:hypothetical protein